MAMVALAARGRFPATKVPASMAGPVGAALIAATAASLTGLALFVLPMIDASGPQAYVAGFIINAVSSATIMIPVPGLAVLLVMAKELDPIMLGVAAGVGGAVGDLVGYWIGARGRGTLENVRAYRFARRQMERFGGAVVLAFALVPVLPMDAIGIVAGATRYPLARYIAFTAAGKILLLVSTFYLTAKAFAWAAPLLGWLT